MSWFWFWVKSFDLVFQRLKMQCQMAAQVEISNFFWSTKFTCFYFDSAIEGSTSCKEKVEPEVFCCPSSCLYVFAHSYCILRHCKTCTANAEHTAVCSIKWSSHCLIHPIFAHLGPCFQCVHLDFRFQLILSFVLYTHCYCHNWIQLECSVTLCWRGNILRLWPPYAICCYLNYNIVATTTVSPWIVIPVNFIFKRLHFMLFLFCAPKETLWESFEVFVCFHSTPSSRYHAQHRPHHFWQWSSSSFTTTTHTSSFHSYLEEHLPVMITNSDSFSSSSALLCVLVLFERFSFVASLP